MMGKLARMRSMGSGAFAQALTLGSTLLPVLWGRGEQLVLLVTASAVATCLVPLLTLAAPHRLPSIAEPRAALRAASTASYIIAVGTILVLLGCLAVATWISGERDPWGIAVAIALLAGSQSAFTLVLAVQTWMLDASAVIMLRLIYGGTLFLATLAVTLSNGSGIAYCAAAALSYVLAAIAFLMIRRDRIVAAFRSLKNASLSEILAEMRSAGVLTLATSIGTIGGQAGALATPLLGSAAVAWAVMIRIMSGFQAFGAQMLGATIDVKFASAIRRSDVDSARRTFARALAAGAVLSILFLVATAVSWWWTGALDVGSADSALAALACAAVVFGGTSVAVAPAGRQLGLVGAPYLRLAWDSIRFVGGGASLVALSGSTLLFALAVVGLVTYIFYVVALSRSIERRNWIG